MKHAESLGRETMNDAELVEGLRQHHGDHSPEEEWLTAEMMRRCKPEIDAILKRTGVSWPDLDDLEQEVFLRVLRNIERLKDPLAFHGWVKVIARTTALNFRMRGAERQRKQTTSLTQWNDGVIGNELDITDDLSPSPLVEMLKGEQQEKLLRALERLKPTDQTRLRQFYLLDLSLNEIVQAEGGEEKTPLGTVKRQLHTARKRLLELMQEGEEED